MKSLCLLPIVLCLLFALSPTAQETTDTGWPIEERCLGEPTPPPDDWTFPGAILMTSHYGIHAVSEDFDTPYVVAFINRSGIIGEAGLSLDGKYYAVLIGYGVPNAWFNPNNIIYSVTGIRIYEMTSQHKIYNLDWDNYFYGDRPPLRWWDKNNLFYNDGGDVITLERSYLISVPDFTRVPAPLDNNLFPLGTINSPNWNYLLQPTYPGWELIDVSSFQPLRSLNLAERTAIIWSSDGNLFAAETQQTVDGNSDFALSLFDPLKDKPIARINLPDSLRIRADYNQINNLTWSEDGRYLAFTTTTFSYPLNLYIADMQEKRVYDTCVETTDGLAWSPDNNMLAMMDFYDYKPHRPVMVLDIDAWAMHTVAYHEGSVIGWRED